MPLANYLVVSVANVNIATFARRGACDALRLPNRAVSGGRGISGRCGDGSVGRVPVVWGRATRGARFCDACGTALMASALAAEYKQVTMLFADVVRSMDIAAAREERLRES